MSGDAARSLDPEFPNLDPAVVEGYRNANEALVAEILGGELVLMPRPRLRHAHGATRLTIGLAGFGAPGEGDPGGWIILMEPELRLGPLPDVVVPDLAGWRRERVPEGFIDDVFASIAPDWVCEVLSPSTEARDRDDKLAIYYREGVAHAWLVSPALHTVEVFRRADIGWLLVNVYRGDAVVRAEPFDALPLALARLWAP
ncbi:MAG: Uma2 family endonuclease [Deltaproteobacteria bacterium]|nr:Uma2 family endonuclease [Deltaproteobacteria bacterium]MBK7069689.1 Uma2 family endonuclease [Deltaproteobacteria bacterium]MBK8692550.1 Uma2 family endonuclease [Deltaproteobacteria bacterium]